MSKTLKTVLCITSVAIVLLLAANDMNKDTRGSQTTSGPVGGVAFSGFGK